MMRCSPFLLCLQSNPTFGVKGTFTHWFDFMYVYPSTHGNPELCTEGHIAVCYTMCKCDKRKSHAWHWQSKHFTDPIAPICGTTTFMVPDGRKFGGSLVGTADGGGRHLVAADGGGRHLVAADGGGEHLLAADGGGGHLVAADGGGEHLLAADGGGGCLVAADGGGRHLVAADGGGGRLVAAHKTNT